MFISLAQVDHFHILRIFALRTMNVEKRVHPMDLGNAYTKLEFIQYGVALERGEQFGIQMWNESVPYDANTPNYGNWSGVVTTPLSKHVICTPISSLREHSHCLVRRSRSCGHQTEMGRETGRHPFGHPTAVGAGWMAAT